MSTLPIGIDEHGLVVHVETASPFEVKASELICQLEKMKEQFGDLPVYFDDDHIDCPMEYVILRPARDEQVDAIGKLPDRFLIC